MISIWCDFIERGFLENEFQELVNKGMIKGATSNPSIFAQALKSDNYKKDIESLKTQKKQPKEIYEALAIQDIKKASQILYPLYRQNPQDGLISIEIDPFLSHDIEASVNEGMRLWHAIGAENVMIKVPATESGYIIMQKLMEQDINVNATLVFTKEQAQNVLRAFQNAKSESQGVISVFVSRFDRAIDSLVNDSLRGKYGIANAIDIYKDFLVKSIKPNHRILFASTGIKEKNHLYNDDGYYVYPLAFDGCVNTLPLQTLQNIDFARLQACTDLSSQHATTDICTEAINITDIEKRLLHEGLKSFEESFQVMLQSLES